MQKKMMIFIIQNDRKENREICDPKGILQKKISLFQIKKKQHRTTQHNTTQHKVMEIKSRLLSVFLSSSLYL